MLKDALIIAGRWFLTLLVILVVVGWWITPTPEICFEMKDGSIYCEKVRRN